MQCSVIGSIIVGVLDVIIGIVMLAIDPSTGWVGALTILMGCMMIAVVFVPDSIPYRTCLLCIHWVYLVLQIIAIGLVILLVTLVYHVACDSTTDVNCDDNVFTGVVIAILLLWAIGILPTLIAGICLCIRGLKEITEKMERKK